MMFIDIETVPTVKNITLLDERGQKLFKDRFKKIFDNSTETPQGIWVDNASLHAEFARVLCITVGVDRTTKDEKEREFRIKSFAERDEKQLLIKACEVLSKETHLVGHNIKSFDLPFIFRRLIIQGLTVPSCLQVAGRKPWDIPHDDTLEMWKCGDYNGTISLDRLAYALGLQSPKEEVSGADVGPLWYSEGEKDELPFDRDDRVLKVIKKYCAGDVFTQANCYFRIKGLPIIQPHQVVYVD